MCEACVKYVPPPEKQCVPCNKNEEERSRGSIWNQMYGDNFEKISESKSPRFNLPVVTICCETTTTAEPTNGMGTRRLQNATGATPIEKIRIKQNILADCGIKGVIRIVGGEDAAENEFPWMCAVLDSDDYFDFCGATLISCDPPIIVSAAHCCVGADG